MPFARPVFLFPGQGAQSVGMGTSLPQASAAARQTMDAAHAAAGFDLPGLCARGPAELLERTEYQQPCVLAVSAAAYFAFRERHDVAPVAAIGHSLGEYTALVAAGVLDVADAVRLTRKRGAYMQEAVPEGEGAMAALLGASATQAEQICVEAGGEVWVANENGGGQVVISGKAADVERARDAAKKYGVRRSVPAAGVGSIPLSADETRGHAPRRRSRGAKIRRVFVSRHRQRRRSRK
ncbi:MAG: acyltransferase domain-containing protein [Deltaproteobacteria bacterium]|nr:acyltransferase domain-containing protein [Deltaproteobacteria bacterium]